MVKKKNSRYSNELTCEEIKNMRYIEEIIARSHQGVTVDEYAPLEKKSRDPEVLARLLELEKSIIERARSKGIIGKD
jgi:hypothetical protein